ncbi:MAG: hypothetical protein AB1899_09425 [Pseudomonadota bacterium]
MIRLPKSLAVWPGPEFRAVLKAEIEALDPDLLPLQAALTRTSHVSERPHGAVILASSEDGTHLLARVGLFYAGIIAGCSCADDPTPVDEISEYCEVELRIDRRTGQASVRLLED